MQPRETFNTVYFPTLEQRKNCYKQKNKCPHSFSNAVRTLAMVPVVGLSAQIVLCLHSVLRARTAFAPRPGKTLHRTVLFPRLRVPFDLTKHRGTQRVPLCLVPVVGLEPTRYCYQRILSPSRLPIPSHRLIKMCCKTALHNGNNDFTV